MRDLHMKKIKYPMPAISYDNDDGSEDDDDTDQEVAIGLEDYHLAKCIITLTEYHTVNNNLVNRVNIYQLNISYIYTLVSCKDILQ